MKAETQGFARDTIYIRDMLTNWISEAKRR